METQVTSIGADVALAAKWLSAGSLVAIPTETVYGLAGNGLNEGSIQQIFAVKGRPSFDPLILHSSAANRWGQWGLTIPALLKPLTAAFWPGPLTVLVPTNEAIPAVVAASLPRVALRVPAHPLALELLARVDFPVAAPSANPFGGLSPTSAEAVFEYFNGKIPYVLNGGPCAVGLESTIVGIENDEPVIYRLGGLAVEQVEALVGPVHVRASSSKPEAPGMLIRHYAPRLPFHTVASFADIPKELVSSTAFIAFEGEVPSEAGFVFWLSDSVSLDEATSKFYNAVRQCDTQQNCHRIVIKPFANTGLGRALNDRLRRATTVLGV